MPNKSKASSGEQLATLAQGVVTDVEKLVGEHIDLLRAEVRQELRRAETAAVALGGGAGLAALGGVLGGLMVVHLLHGSTRLPLWACYGLVGGAFGAGGAALLSSGAREVAELGRAGQETARAVREDVAWVKEQALPARG